MPINSFDNYPMTWKPNISDKKPPLYKALADLLEEDIKNGKLKPADQLPPQRELADYLDVNLSTISRAFKLCEQKGLICATVGRGTYISSDVDINSTLLDPTKTKGLIEMGAIHPPYNQNAYVVDLIANMMKKPDAAKLLEYSEPAGSIAQKQSAVAWFKKVKLDTTKENVLISNGGQNALCAILSSLFQAGDRIGTDPLVYAGIKTLAKMLGIQLVPIAQKKGEMSPEALINYCKNEGLKGIYLIPDYQNPTTHIMSLDTRKEIAAIATQYNIIVIEDGIHTFLGKNNIQPIAMLAPEHTIYISSTSKTLCAGTHIGFISVPDKYYKTIELALYNINMMVSPLTAEIIHQIISQSLADKIVSERKKMVVTRNKVTDSILTGYDVRGDEYSNFRWLLLPSGWTGKTFETCAKSAGVQVYCAERFAVGNVSVPAAVRISIAAPKSLEELEKGLNIIKSLLDQEDEFTMI